MRYLYWPIVSHQKPANKGFSLRIVLEDSQFDWQKFFKPNTDTFATKIFMRIDILTVVPGITRESF